MQDVAATRPDPTPIGEFVLRRMAEIGMTRQSELAARAQISDSTVHRIIYRDDRINPATLVAVARALDLPPRDLMGFFYPVSASEADDRRESDPLSAEIGRMLGADSPIPEADRNKLRIILDAVVASYRPAMTKRAGPRE